MRRSGPGREGQETPLPPHTPGLGLGEPLRNERDPPQIHAQYRKQRTAHKPPTPTPRLWSAGPDSKE